MKTIKTSYIPPSSLSLSLSIYLSLISSEISYNTKQKLHFNDLKGLKFCERNFQYVAILRKRLEIFIFIFFNFNSAFFQNIFHCNILLGRGLPMIPNLSNSFKSSKYQSFWNWFRLKESLLSEKDFQVSSVEFILDQSQQTEHSLDFIILG